MDSIWECKSPVHDHRICDFLISEMEIVLNGARIGIFWQQLSVLCVVWPNGYLYVMKRSNYRERVWKSSIKGGSKSLNPRNFARALWQCFVSVMSINVYIFGEQSDGIQTLTAYKWDSTKYIVRSNFDFSISRGDSRVIWNSPNLTEWYILTITLT